jgi:hypothetical protein
VRDATGGYKFGRAAPVVATLPLILLIDDDPALMHSLEIALETYGIRVPCASVPAFGQSGSFALEHAPTIRHSLIWNS